MTKKKHQPGEGLALAFLVACATIQVGCGPLIDPGLTSPEPYERGTANLASFKSWEKDWKTGTWIATVTDASWRSPLAERERTFRSQVLESLFDTALQGARSGSLATWAGELPVLRTLAAADSTGDHLARAHQGAWEFLNQQVTVELVSTRSHLPWDPQILGRKTPPTFLYITLKDARHSAPHFFDLVGWAAHKQIADAGRKLAHWQSLSLRRLPNVEAVEPNLYSRFNHPQLTPNRKAEKQQEGSFLQDDTPPDEQPAEGATAYTPPEFEFRSEMVDNLRLIKADLAYNFTGQGVRDRRPPVVAVLDTGVDSAHPDLAQQMWVNQNENPENSIDDDQNGAVDDIHGFDATLDENTPAGVSPRPGWDDIGGPGASCPSPAKPVKGDNLVSNCGHGTHVAGIIAAQHGADTLTLGVCPNCRIMSVRVSERCVQPDTAQNNGECVVPTKPLKETQYEVDGNISDIAQVRALQYIFNTRKKGNPNALEVNIVNMSLGKYFRSRAMSYLIQSLQANNVLVVAAAGNDDTDTASYPAAYESVVAVCATSTRTARGTYAKSEFSNFGEWVDICAPGRDIYSTVPGKIGDGSGNTDEKSGTSQATPFVAGALGYLMSISPSQVGVRELVRTLQQSAQFRNLYFEKGNTIGKPDESAYLACYPDNSSCDYLLGTGFLNLYKAVNPAAKDPFTQVDFATESPIEGGCVVSTIGKSRSSGVFQTREGSHLQWRAVTASVPFLLGLFAAILMTKRKRHLRQGGSKVQSLE